MWDVGKEEESKFLETNSNIFILRHQNEEMQPASQVVAVLLNSS